MKTAEKERARAMASMIPRVKIAVLPFLQKPPAFAVDFGEYSRLFCAETAGFLSVLRSRFLLCFVSIF